MSHVERNPRPVQISPHMSPVAYSPGVVLFEYDENLVFEHEMLGFRVRQIPTLKRMIAAAPVEE